MRKPSRIARWLAALGLVVLVITVPVLALWRWAQAPPRALAESTGTRAEFDALSVTLVWPEGTSLGDGAELLQRAGFDIDARWFSLYTRIFATTDVEPGEHILRRDSSVAELVQCLRRAPRRPSLRVNIPEGFNLFQIAERLAERSIAPRAAFLGAALPSSPARGEGTPFSERSWEGQLFPASYDLYLNSRPEQILRRLADEMDKRWRGLIEHNSEAWQALQKQHGWARREVVILASMIQAEGADETEFSRIASVFFNRLEDPAFKPNGMLQSDPTAGYGCLLEGDRIESCKGYSGRIKPSMLRDASNRYNTYRHAGLPPGPIGNPGVAALRAVLQPERTDYFYFYADGRGGHRFSRTLADHERAIAGE